MEALKKRVRGSAADAAPELVAVACCARDVPATGGAAYPSNNGAASIVRRRAEGREWGENLTAGHEVRVDEFNALEPPANGREVLG